MGTGKKGIFVLQGRMASGKTTQALETFQDCLYIGSAVNQDQFYEEWLRPRHKELKPIKMRHEIGAYSVNGGPIKVERTRDGKRRMVKVEAREALEDVIDEATIALAAGKAPFKNLIIDEVTVFWDRVFLEIANEMNLGLNGQPQNRDSRSWYGALSSWTRQVVDRLGTAPQYGANVVLIGGNKLPDGGKVGGIAVPGRGAMTIFGHAAHGYFERVIEGEKKTAASALDILADAGKKIESVEQIEAAEKSAEATQAQDEEYGRRRVWIIHATAKQDAKARGIPESEFESMKDKHLREIVQAMGFEP